MKLLISSVLIVLLISSCTITQEFYFNKDFSGSAKLSVDMSMFIGVMQSMDTSSKSGSLSDSIKYMFEEGKPKLDSVGATNVKYSWSDSAKTMQLSFNFKDIDILNKSLNITKIPNSEVENDSNTTVNHKYFTKIRRKTLVFEEKKTTKKRKTSKEMSSMKEYYKYNIIFVFDRKIKKVENPNISHIKNSKRVELKGNVFDMMKKDYNSKIIFKLK